MAQTCTCSNSFNTRTITFGTPTGSGQPPYTTGADPGFENILCNGCTDCCGKAGYGKIRDRDVTDIRKTRGVSLEGSKYKGNRGPRGQELSFRSFDGTEQGTRNVGQMVLGYLAVGLTAFVVGYSLMKGKERAN